MTPLGSEEPNTCSLHFGVLLTAGECPLCLLAGLKVVVCDPLDIEQVMRAMDVVGATFVRDRSRAVLTFTRPEGPMKAGDVIPKKPGVRAGRPAPSTANGKAVAR